MLIFGLLTFQNADPFAITLFLISGYLPVQIQNGRNRKFSECLLWCWITSERDFSYTCKLSQHSYFKRTATARSSSVGSLRHCNYSGIAEVVSFITEQLGTSGSHLGYRILHLRCIDAGFIIQKETVRRLLYILDPLGVQSRMRHRLCRRQYTSDGQNFIWHVDSYNKLKLWLVY